MILTTYLLRGQKKSGDKVKRNRIVNEGYLLWIYAHWNTKLTLEIWHLGRNVSVKRRKQIFKNNALLFCFNSSHEWVWKKVSCFLDLNQSIMRMVEFCLVNFNSSSSTLSNCADWSADKTEIYGHISGFYLCFSQQFTIRHWN